MNKRLENKTLTDILFILRKYIVLIVILAIVFGVTFFSVAKYLVPPKYQSTSTLIVNSAQTTNDGTLAVTQIDAYQKLVSTIAQVITSDTVLQPVSRQLNLHISTDALAGKISVAGIGTTNVMQLKVTDNDPVSAAAIANAIDTLAPNLIMNNVTSAASVNVLTQAKVNNKPISPNVPLMTVLGVLIGIVVAGCFAILRDLMDNTFKTDDDIKEVLDMTVLGIIPVVLEKTK